MTKHLRVLRCVLYCVPRCTRTAYHASIALSVYMVLYVLCMCIALYLVVCVSRMGERLNSLTVCWLGRRNGSWAEHRQNMGGARTGEQIL